MSQRVLFKKYANRRLYDTERSVYVTLNDIADLIREGRHVYVIDAKTEEDVTAFTLTQIILEESRKKNALLPISLLHLIIQFGDNLLVEFFEKYLYQTIKNYLAYKTALDQQFKNWLDLGMNLTEMTPKHMTDFNAINAFFDMFPYTDDHEKKNSKI